MGIEKFYDMLKQANVTNGLKLLDDAPKLEPLAPIPKPPKLPEIPKPKELKLTSGIGKSKAPFVHKTNDNSPYNQR